MKRKEEVRSRGRPFDKNKIYTIPLEKRTKEFNNGMYWAARFMGASSVDANILSRCSHEKFRDKILEIIKKKEVTDEK